MIDALKRLLADRDECCKFYRLVVCEEGPSILEDLQPPPESTSPAPDGLNESQLLAMNSWRSPLSLIWGPPGTNISISFSPFVFDIATANQEQERPQSWYKSSAILLRAIPILCPKFL